TGNLCFESASVALRPRISQLTPGAPSEATRGGRDACDRCGYSPTIFEKAPPLEMSDPKRALKHLRLWAALEGETDVEVFCQSNMGLSADQVVDLLRQKQKVGTTFDVIAFLFPGGGQGGRETEGPPIKVVQQSELPPTPPPLETSTSKFDPRIPARALVSVMVADGELRGGEEHFIARFLEREGLPPLSQQDMRVWRPQEVGKVTNPAMRELIVEAMVHLMHLDRERDGSEWKVITAYARAWNVDDERLKHWDQLYDRRYSSSMSALWRALSHFVRLH
ncbi:MAG: hypothetical protein HN348_03285, partial [Proteobacteria bacterium]|nr:hypothetical protein [Pseudomonadota bacterium]